MSDIILRLTPKQRVVLDNALAWCSRGFQPTNTEIEDFFAHNDAGKPIATDGGLELQMGWTAHYSDPFKWIAGWETNKLKNHPTSPPAAWIYDAYWSDGTTWCGWAAILLDFIRDCLAYGQSWERTLPAYNTAYRLAAYFHGCNEALTA